MKLHRSRRTPIATGSFPQFSRVPPRLRPASVAAQTGGALEEILVTATRRGETNLQETPVAVTALDSQATSIAWSARDIEGIASSVPNFSAARITAFNAASFAIRGVGQTDIIVYLDSPVGGEHRRLRDAQRADAAAGYVRHRARRGAARPAGHAVRQEHDRRLVNVTTKKPSLEEGSVELRALGAAASDATSCRARSTSPIGDTFGLRFVGNYNKSDGYYENGATYGPHRSPFVSQQWDRAVPGQGNGEDVGGDDIFNGRVKALWEPNEDLSVLLQYEIVRDRSDAVPSFNDTPREPGCVPFGLTFPVPDPIAVCSSGTRSA